MQKKVLALAVAVAACSANFANATPMDPRDKPVTQEFSAEILANFDLFADSDNDKIVWYVPKLGNIALQATHTTDPRPRFAASSRQVTRGIFEGETIVNLGGSFSTSGSLGALQRLNNEASSYGLTARAAPASKAAAKFMVSAIDVGAGRADVKCAESDDITGLGSVVECEVKSLDGQYYPTDMLYRLNSRAPQGKSTVSQNIPFQAVLLPGFDQLIQDKLNEGAQWDDLITADVEWEIGTERKTRVARAKIKWKQIFEQAHTYMSVHNFACVDVEIEAFFQNLATCPNEEQCGVKLEFLHSDGKYYDQPPSDAAFNDAVRAFQKDLETELFNEVAVYQESQIDPLKKSRSAVFTLKANYQKILVTKNETRYLYWNPGRTVQNSATTMNIGCVTGNLGGKMSWDMGDPACRDIANQQ
ncbi:hypothetical protein [Spartinivicinus ruber]|uniref:hypothetical protein n=1 Tax=Spartinivicinus ruber TaxID=2683272 RepID=UPI0013D20CD9|nr:hypothetical protein [Spartinivicinus ruber]